MLGTLWLQEALCPCLGRVKPCKGELDLRAGSELAYLAQHALFDQIPELAADIRQPEYCSLGEGGDPAVNAWMGPAGTVRLVSSACQR